MKIRELFEQTISPQPPGQGQPTTPTEGPPNTSNTPKTTQPTGTAPTTQAGQTPAQQPAIGQPATGQPAANANTNTLPQVGKPMGSNAPQANQQQQQQMAQQSKDTMTDLDKIAAQIVGLKQKQQQMQQQLQRPAL